MDRVEALSELSKHELACPVSPAFQRTHNDCSSLFSPCVARRVNNDEKLSLLI